MAEDIFADEMPVAATDDLPPPAYQPQVAAFEPQDEALDANPDAFVAPRAPTPGTPSPEAMARLRAAAQKATPAPAPAAPQVQASEAERPRFGINSLINRMTGHGEQAAPERPARQQPPVQQQAAAPAQQPVEAVDPDQERIEIPAFLRRQAN
jgi:cell division protein FtsZ